MRNRVNLTASTVAVLFTLGISPASEAAFTRAPWIQDATSTTITVAWEAGSYGAQKMTWGQGAAMDHSIDAVNVSPWIYEAKLTGLTGSTKFSYQVTSGSDTSEAGTFVTAPSQPEPFRFGVYGDNRTNDTAHASVVAATLPFAPDFMLNTGDFTELNEYRTFMQIEHPLLANTPMFPVPGNHEVLTSLYRTGFARPEWYSFRWGNAFFIAISTQDSYAVGSTQYAWVEQQLIAAKADPSINWIVAYHHFPVYSSSLHGSTPDMLTSLNLLYKQYGVDVVFNGHDHDYERVEQDGILYAVVGGGGAPLYTAGHSAPGWKYSESALSVVMVDVDGGTLHLGAYRTDGSLMDERTLTKGPVTGGPTPTPPATPGPTPTPGSGTPTPTPAPGDPAAGGGTHGGCDLGAIGGPSAATVLAFGLGIAALAVLARRRRPG